MLDQNEKSPLINADFFRVLERYSLSFYRHLVLTNDTDYVTMTYVKSKNKIETKGRVSYDSVQIR